MLLMPPVLLMMPPVLPNSARVRRPDLTDRSGSGLCRPSLLYGFHIRPDVAVNLTSHVKQSPEMRRA